MRIGQTSLVVFLAKVVGSAIGFVATIYFARVLGSEVIGIYAVVMSTAKWLQTGGRMGVSNAVNKRVSEGNDRGEHLAAGLVSVLVFLAGVSVLVVLFQSPVEAYIDDFETYTEISVIWFVTGLIVVQLLFLFLLETLKGQRLVHVAGLLKPVRTATRSAIQVTLVVFGWGIVGLFVGYAAGAVLVGVVGVAFVSVRPRVPGREHFESLLEYARFSWLSGLKSRALNDVDIVVLGALVPSSLVGVYAVAWSLTKFLSLFGNAVSQAIFPEISNAVAQDRPDDAVAIVEDALAYAGLIAIPGLAGGLILADRLLRIYGPDFVQGTEVLWLLLLAIVWYSYFRQFLNALNGMDQPGAAFRANLVFILSNIVLNVVLIWQIGFVGAAIASVLSVLLGTVVAYGLLSQFMPVTLPLAEIGRQVLAAVVMGGLVFLGERAVETTGLLQRNVLIVGGLVVFGAGIYVVVLFVISAQFRATVRRNLPVDVSL